MTPDESSTRARASCAVCRTSIAMPAGPADQALRHGFRGERKGAATVADMTSRTFTVATATTAIALAVTACGSSPEPESPPAPDLTSWAADNVPVPDEGGFSMTSIAAPDGAPAGDSTPDEPAPETFSVKVLTDGQEVYWGLSASPTTSPE